MLKTLKWDGPFTFFDHGDTRWCFAADGYREAQGLYLHVLQSGDSHFVYYVGISGKRDIVSRQREHATGYLSGGYWFYDPQESIKQGELVRCYGEKNQDIAYDYWEANNNYRHFMAAGNVLRKEASRWLDSLHIFYCIPEGSLNFTHLKLYESTIIHHLLCNKRKGECGALCDNQKVSIRPDHKQPIEMVNRFDDGITVVGLMGVLRYPI